MRRGGTPRVRVVRPAQRSVDDRAVDGILKKVYENGLFSLTEEEKTILREASERLQEREAGSGRSGRI